MQLSICSFVQAALLAIGVTILSHTPEAIAAEKVTLKYKVFRESVSVPQLTAFAQTGEISQSLRFYLDATRQNPEDVRQVLNRPIDVNVVTLDRTLNSRIGELLLDQVGQAIHPPVAEVNRQALRSALVLSAQSDNQVSLIEVLQNYPTAEVEVEGDRLVQAYRQLSALNGRLRNVAEELIRRL
ncbi:alpha/beta hydrolase [Phormidesmis priestleyi]